MKLASFAVETPVGRARRVGVMVEDEDRLVDVTTAYAASLAADGVVAADELAQATAPPEMVAFLERGDRALEAAREARQYALSTDETTGPSGGRLVFDHDEVDLLSPVPRPTSLRDCMVFEEHVRNSLGDDIPDVWYERPVYYKGNPGSVVGPGAEVEWPAYSDTVDYELEVAAVVGKEGRDIPVSEADEYIAGYTVFDDFSARDTQMAEMQGRLGPAKGKDFANALGPYLTTADSIDITEARMEATVDGEVWSEGTPGHMEHSFAEIVSYISQSETLHPGDVIGSGTVGEGCGLELGQFPEFGDTIALTVEGIGTLENRIAPR